MRLANRGAVKRSDGFGMGAAVMAALAMMATSAQAQGPVIDRADPASAPLSVIPWLDKAREDPAAAAKGAPAAGGDAAGAAPIEPEVIDPSAGADAAAAPIGAPNAASTPNAPAETPAAATAGAPGVAARAPSAAVGGGWGGEGASVEVAPLEAIGRGAVGLIGAEEAGLPIDAWRGASATEAERLVASLKPGPSRTVNRLIVRLLTARLEAPRPAPGERIDMLTARIDALMRFGAAAEAAALAEAAGPDAAIVHANAAFLSGRDAALCHALLSQRASAGLPLIYCQAVAEDRVGAMLSIDATRALGDADETTLGLLEALADPELADGMEAPKDASALTPIGLAAMARLGLAPPIDFARDGGLTLAAAATLTGAAPRARLEALERLEAAGAIETEALRAAFADTKSAESGGVWGRVAAFGAAAADGADADAFEIKASEAIARAREAGVEASMARLLAPIVAKRALPSQGVRPAALATPAMRDLLRRGGLAKAASALSRSAARSGPPSIPPDAVERGLDRLAEPDWPTSDPGVWAVKDFRRVVAKAERGDRGAARLLAALEAFGAEGAPAPRPDGLDAAVATDRAAASAFTALAALSRDDELTPDGLGFALKTLLSLGYQKEAVAAAMELALAR